MEAKVIWLFAFVGMYWAYCIFWGVKGALQAKTASDYFIAGRRMSMWVFILAATATSFSGWPMKVHPENDVAVAARMKTHIDMRRPAMK